ncbi:MAG: phosphate signaling complex protein PhoU [Planctomycetota bacterium]|jgi:phosphate transport system protein
MTHYEQRVERDLENIRSQVADLAGRVDGAVEKAVHGLLHLERELASRVILGDYPINTLRREIEHLCHVFVARHLPSAGILRYISSVLRLTVELERIGDYAVSMARETVQLEKPLPGTVARDLEMMARHSGSVLRQALEAFRDGNVELARSTKVLTTEARADFDQVYADLLREAEQGTRSITDIFAILFAFMRLVRINDQTRNICEETLFAATGEAKGPGRFRILFVDEKSTFRSVMAKAIASKAFPSSGEYEFAGWNPAREPDPKVLEFLDAHGHAVNTITPRPLPATPTDLAEYDVIVGLKGEAAPHLGAIPFRSTLVHWEVGPGTKEVELTDEVLETTYKELTTEIRELMETLRGERAG